MRPFFARYTRAPQCYTLSGPSNDRQTPGKNRRRPRTDEVSARGRGARTPPLAKQVGGGGAPDVDGRLRYKAPLPKIAASGFSMDRKKDGKGNLSVATRRVTTENAPCPVFCETRKDAPGVWQGRLLTGNLRFGAECAETNSRGVRGRKTLSCKGCRGILPRPVASRASARTRLR